MSQRRIASILGINRKTVVRKFLYLARQSRESHNEWLRTFQSSRVQFDEMESFEHTRLKPLSIALCTDEATRHIVDVRVAKMPYRGRLAGLAFAKYGPRIDDRPRVRFQMLSALRPSIQTATIVTDHHPAYPALIGKALPSATHIAAKAKEGREFRAQGSRRNVNDPLFALNHTAATLRSDLSRLLRRVWVTTKKQSRLQAHLDLYLAFRNGYPITR
jgi:hypothetical protein